MSHFNCKTYNLILRETHRDHGIRTEHIQLGKYWVLSLGIRIKTKKKKKKILHCIYMVSIMAPITTATQEHQTDCCCHWTSD